MEKTIYRQPYVQVDDDRPSIPHAKKEVTASLSTLIGGPPPKGRAVLCVRVFRPCGSFLVWAFHEASTSGRAEVSHECLTGLGREVSKESNHEGHNGFVLVCGH